MSVDATVKSFNPFGINKASMDDIAKMATVLACLALAPGP